MTQEGQGLRHKIPHDVFDSRRNDNGEGSNSRRHPEPLHEETEYVFKLEEHSAWGDQDFIACMKA